MTIADRTTSVRGRDPAGSTRRAREPQVARNFRGFTPSGLGFLRELAANNEPTWFKPRREIYEEHVRGPMVALVADILSLAAAARLPVGGEPAKAVFRIYRDVRFSSDKRPYKTHVGAAMTRSGDKGDPGILYVHIEPGGCFFAAGFWQPAPEFLARLRHALVKDPRGFGKIVKRLDDAGLPLTEDGDALKRLPRGFEAASGTEVEPFLKQRNLVVRQSITDAGVQNSDLPDAAITFYRAAHPLLAFGWDAAKAG